MNTICNAMTVYEVATTKDSTEQTSKKDFCFFVFANYLHALCQMQTKLAVFFFLQLE